MTRFIFFLYFSIATLGHVAGTTVDGIVKDHRGEAIPGVNVYLLDTYDGSTTNADGAFSFETFESGEQVLIASFIGYKTYETKILIEDPQHFQIILKEEVNKLTGVVITAGTFEASDERKSVVLKPLDIATTAGATADVPGALNTLPGTTINGETGRLFVRGGSSNETKAFVDGVLVHNFYNATPNNVPSRSRFSPFLFKGTFFSTGGYSAEYGQALSSVLSLNSVDIPEQTQSDISIMSVGADVSHTQKWEDGSVYGQVQYTNLDPYVGLVKQSFRWEDGFTSGNGTFMLRQKFNKSDMFKLYANYDRSGFVVHMPNVNTPEHPDRVDVTNKNAYINGSYRRTLGENTTGYVGISFGRNIQQTDLNQDLIDTRMTGWHFKSYLTRDLLANLSIKFGAELVGQQNEENVDLTSGVLAQSQYRNTNLAGFVESDFYINNSMTLRFGARASKYTLFDRAVLSPRASLAYETGTNSQMSLSYGRFHQLPEQDVLLRTDQVDYEKADHYMLNYQRSFNGRTFRAEAYLKNYSGLIRFDGTDIFNPSKYSNDGSGYARGLDVFWRDSKTIRRGDYWISYSFIDSRRQYRDFPVEARPQFVSRHNISLVYKHFISDLKTQIGSTFSYNSGRPYHNPNNEGFNDETTKHYANLSFNLAYLPKQNIIIYGSVTNLLGRDNIFGYQYEDQAGANAVFDRIAIGQAARRFFFVGVFITLTKDKSANQLDNL